jgi:3-methyladenine DNA glycosylase AlkD
MKTAEARALGEVVGLMIGDGQPQEAYGHLSPILAERTPFHMLRRIGEPIGACPVHSPVAVYDQALDSFLQEIASGRTEGGWVIIASALHGQLERALASALARCRGYIIAADVWYGADILAEGVAGEALVAHFQPTVDQISRWRQDPNAWVRRAVGTAAHFWAKRSRGAAELSSRAQTLLDLLEPMFEEWDMRAVKGVGWGLKTLGRYYPDLVADWLAHSVEPRQRHHRALILRKALTFLSEEQRARAVGETALSRSPERSTA